MFPSVVHIMLKYIVVMLLLVAGHCQLLNDIESALESLLHRTSEVVSTATTQSTICTKLANCNHVKSKQNSQKSQPNGCGSKLYDIKVPQFEFNSCCNNHDDCYSNCNSSFEKCNNDFFSCMNHVCNKSQ